MIEKLNAINIISTAGLSEENKIFLFGKLFGGLDGHLTVHGSLSRFFTHIALVGIYLLAVDDGIFDQTILHQVVELLILVLSVDGILVAHGTSHLGGLY